MTTTNPNTNQPGLLDRATSFFKGTSKKPTNTLTSSLEHLHTNQHAQADAEAHHQAQLMSGLPSDMPSGTESLSSSTIPHPMPRQVLNDVLGAQGHVPHAHHVNVDKVEQQHEQAVGPLGHVQQTTLLNKAKHAIDSLTGKTTTTQHPIQHHPNIPHSVLPDATLKQVQTAQGHPPHAKHVNIDTVEQRHEQAAGPLGHVQPEPSVLEKMSQKLQDLVPPTTFNSTSTVQTHPNIPHAAVPDQVLLDVQSQHGKVPNAQHVDLQKVEQRHEQAVGPLGEIQKEPGLLERMGNKISELVPSLTPVTTTSTSNIPIHTHPSIPHAALSNNVLRDIQLHHGKVPHAHHVDIAKVEKQHEQTLPLGHVQDVTLLHKAKHAIDSLTGKTVAPLQHRPIQRHHNIPHSVLPDATLLQIHAAHGHPPHVKHVDIGLVEQRQEHRMIQAVGPLGRVLPGPTLLEKASQKIQRLTEPLATSLATATATATATSTRPTVIQQHPNIPHAAVPNQVLHDVQTQKGKVPHAQHVDIKQVEKQHERAVGPLGHVQPEPTILDKMANKLQDIMNRPTTTATTTSSLDAHPNIPHAAVPDQVLKDVQSQKGKVPHAHHVDLAKVEQRHDQAVGPLGHVQQEPTLMDKAKQAIGMNKNEPININKNEPTTKGLHIKNVPDAQFINIRQPASNTTLPATSSALPGTTTLPLNDQGVMPMQSTQPSVVPVQPTLLDKMEYASFGVVPTKAAPTTTTTTATDMKKPTSTTTATDQHANIPHAAVPDQVLKDVQHQKGKVPHAHHVDINKVEQRHEQAVGPLGHVQKEPTLMDKAKQAIGMNKNKITTNKDEPTVKDLHVKNVPDAQFINIPQTATTSSLVGGAALPATASALPGTTTLPLNDQGVMPIQQPVTTTAPSVVPVQPTLLDKMEYKLFGVVPTKAPTTTTTATTATDTKKPTTITTDEHANIPHAAVPDQVLKDVQSQKGKVPHAHHVDINKVEQRHEQAVGPLGHVQKEPTLMDKAKHALGMDKDKTTDQSIETRPNIMHNSLPSYVMSDIKDAHGQVPHSHHVNMTQSEKDRDRDLSNSNIIGRVKDDTTRPNIMHNSLPTRVMNELADQHGEVPHAHHVDIHQVENQRDQQLSQHGLIGHVIDPSHRPNIMHSSLPTRTLNEIQHTEGQVPHAHHIDTQQMERQRQHNLSQNKDIGRVMEPSSSTTPNIMHNSLPTRVMQDVKDAHGQVPHAHHVDINQVEKQREKRLSDSHLMGRLPPERSNSGYTVGGFPESNEHITSSAPAPTAYFKNTSTSLTSDMGEKSGISNQSTTPLVATLPHGSNLESASGLKFQPSNTTSNTTSNIKQPTFHPQQ